MQLYKNIETSFYPVDLNLVDEENQQWLFIFTLFSDLMPFFQLKSATTLILMSYIFYGLFYYVELSTAYCSECVIEYQSVWSVLLEICIYSSFMLIIGSQLEQNLGTFQYILLHIFTYLVSIFANQIFTFQRQPQIRYFWMVSYPHYLLCALNDQHLIMTEQKQPTIDDMIENQFYQRKIKNKNNSHSMRKIHEKNNHIIKTEIEKPTQLIKIYKCILFSFLIWSSTGFGEFSLYLSGVTLIIIVYLIRKYL